MYCIKLSILPYQLFMFNDFNDLETFRASDKRTSSDFNEYLKYLNIFKITSSNNGYRPSSPKTAMFVVLLPTPRENLPNLICTFSCFMFLLKLNRKRSSLLILLTIDVPHTSLPYNSTCVYCSRTWCSENISTDSYRNSYWFFCNHRIGYTVSNDTIIKNFLETKEFLNP